MGGRAEMVSRLCASDREGVQTGGGSLDEWMSKVGNVVLFPRVLYPAGRMTQMMGISELDLELETIKELGSILKRQQAHQL